MQQPITNQSAYQETKQLSGMIPLEVELPEIGPKLDLESIWDKMPDKGDYYQQIPELGEALPLDEALEVTESPVTETQRFFDNLYGDSPPGYLTIWTKDKKTRWYPGDGLKQAAGESVNLANTQDVYFGVGLCKEEKGKHKRGSSKDVIAIPGLWVDIDIKGPAHARKDLPPDGDTVKAILQQFPIAPSLVINSGHGLHAYWLFKDLWVFNSDTAKQAAADLLKDFQKAMARLFRSAGYHLDGTGDLARLLRVPGTLNHKSEPVQVKTLEDTGCRYEIEQLNEAVKSILASITSPVTIPAAYSTVVEAGVPTTSAELIMERCAFIKHCREHSASLPEPDWYYGLISIISRTEKGIDIVHALSQNYPRYSFEETKRKIIHALNDGGATTCVTIQEKCGAEYCTGCRFNGKIRSPIVLGTIAKKESSEGTKAFPIDALPESLRRYVVESAESICCPVDFIAVAILVCAAAVIGTSKVISPKEGWREHAGLYAAIVGDPAAKKSPALRAAARFIEEKNKALMEDYEGQVADYEAALREYESDKQDGVANEQLVKPDKPLMPRLYTMDTTVEALTDLMAQNPKGIMILRDELSALTKAMNQYKGGNGSDRQFFLTCWTGAPYTVDRKNKDPLNIPKTYLSIVGAIPPDIIGDLLDSQKRDDGFLDRFMFAYPEPKTQRWTDATVSLAAVSEARDCFDGLFAIRDGAGAEPDILTLTQDALTVYKDWYNGHNAELGNPDFPYKLRGPWGKMPGQALRIAW